MFCAGGQLNSEDGTRMTPIDEVQDKAPVGDLRDEIPQKLKYFDICETLFRP